MIDDDIKNNKSKASQSGTEFELETVLVTPLYMYERASILVEGFIQLSLN